MKLNNIEDLINDNGQVTLGVLGPVSCAACATDGNQALAMLARQDGETLASLLRRLDRAIGRAWEHDEFLDEIN